MSLLDLGALPASKSRLLHNLADATFLATAALLGASCPLRPGTGYTVDGTGVQVASFRNLEIAAGSATKGRLANHTTTVSLVACTARLGARAEWAPLGVG